MGLKFPSSCSILFHIRPMTFDLRLKFVNIKSTVFVHRYFWCPAFAFQPPVCSPWEIVITRLWGYDQHFFYTTSDQHILQFAWYFSWSMLNSPYLFFHYVFFCYVFWFFHIMLVQESLLVNVQWCKNKSGGSWFLFG